jgi:hypothetical protein
MVLRGTQFQRFGPAGCAVLTRRALSSSRALFVQRQSDTVCQKRGCRIPRRHMMRFHGGDQLWVPHKGLAS